MTALEIYVSTALMKDMVKVFSVFSEDSLLA